MNVLDKFNLSYVSTRKQNLVPFYKPIRLVKMRIPCEASGGKNSKWKRNSLKIYDAMHDLAQFVQFKKCKKDP